jgi:hypothetical protein
MAFSKLTVIVTAAHVVQDDEGRQLIPGFVYDVKDAPVIQQLLGDDSLRVVPSKEEDAVETVAPKPAKPTKDSASADSNPS